MVKKPYKIQETLCVISGLEGDNQGMTNLEGFHPSVRQLRSDPG